MNLSELINEIVSDWAYKVNDGMPNPKNPMHVKELENVLSEMGLGYIKSELLKSINEAEAGGFTNPALNKKVRYKNANGEDKEGIVGNLLRQPEDSPGRKAAEATLPPEGSPERETMNQELGSEKDGKAKPPEDAKGKEGEDGKEGGADAEAEKKKKAAAMFDPKADPAMGARMDREKAANDKLAQKDKEGSEAEKAPTPGSPEDFKNKADKVAKDKEEAKKKGYDDSLHAMSDTQLDTAMTDAEKKMNDAQKSGDDKAADKANTEYAQHKVEKEMRNASKGGDKEIADAAVGNFLARKKEYEEKYGEPYKADIPYPDSDGGERTSAKWGDAEPTGPEAGPNAEPPMDEPSRPDTTPTPDQDVPDANSPNDTEVPPVEKIEDTKIEIQKAQNRLKALERMKQDNPEQFATPEKKAEWAKNKEILASKKQELADLESQQKFDAKKKTPTEQPSEPAKREPANDDPESKAQKFKGNKSGEEIQTMEMEGGGFVYGTKHGNTAMVDDILDDVKSKIPKERWKDIVFVGEGGATNDETGEIDFNDEMDYAAPKFKELGAGVDTWDGDDMDVHKSDSKLYQKQKEKTGLKDNQILAGNWASMVGQGEGEGLDPNDPEHTMKSKDYLDDEGKQFLQDAAKEAGLPPIEDFDNPTGEKPSEENGWKGTGDRGTLYRLSFPGDNGDKETKINDIQVAFNDARDEHLIEKNKELTSKGKIPITIAGETHVDLVDKMTRKSSDTKPEDKPTEPTKPEETPKATKDDIKKEKPGKEAKTDSGGSLYSVGGGYYSDKPNGPAKYVRTESVIEMAFDDSLNEDVFALFEKSITGTLQNGEKITVQELPPRAVKKATQRAKAAAASSKEEPTQPTSTSTEKPAKQPKAGDFNPINADDVKKEMPKANTDTFGSKPDIPDEIDPKDLEQFNTDIEKVGKQISDAKERGEKAPNINLCDVTVPGTNLYCDDNLGIPRAAMPQFKGKPQPGTPAADMPVDKNGEVDTEPLFKKMLEEKGIKVVQTEVAADKLKATQSELVADKVIGMMNTLENDPTNESLTAPIYVSRDGYVIDGHHRWAAITAYNAKHPDNQIPMKVQAIDMDVKEAIPMCNDFAEQQGVAAKKADANQESDIQNVTSLPEPKPEDPEEKKNWFQKQKERIQQKFKVMKEAGKQFFGRGGHKPGSVPRRSFGQALVDKIKGIPKAVKDGIIHHAVMFKDASVAIFEAGVHGGLGTIEDPETGERFNHDDHIAVDENGKKRYEKIPQYETDSHGHVINDPETGKPMQKRHWLTGNLMNEDRPIPKEDMSDKQKELFYKSYQKEKKQIKAIVGTGKAIMITAAGAYGLSAAMGHAYTTAGQLMTSTAIELVPHTIVEGTVLGIGKAALYAGAVEMNHKKKLEEFSTNLVKTIGEYISSDKEIPADVLANSMELYNNIDKLRENMDKIPDDEGFLKDYVELHDQIEKDGKPKKEMTIESLIREMISEIRLEEAKPKQDDPDVKYIDVKGKSRTIKFSSAVQYDEKHPAYIAAMKLKDTGSKSTDTQTVKGTGLFKGDYEKERGGTAPTSTSKKSNTKVNYDDRVDGETSAKVEETYNNDSKFSEPGMTHEDRVKHLKKMKSTEINYVEVDDVYTAMGVQEGATKFPAKYMSVLTNALNYAKGKFTITDLTDAAGAGTLDSTLGELTTLMGATIQDPAKRKEFFDYLREQVKKGENKSALTIAWVNSAQDSCEAFHRKLKKDCPGGHEVQTNFWDIPSEAKAAGVKNYKRDKGKSTDINTMVDCIAKDGTRTQKWLQPSLKKNKKVNGFNSTTGRVFATTVLRWASPQVKAQYSALGNELDSYDGLDDNAPAGEYTITDKKGNVRPMAIKERKSQLNRMMRDIEKDFEDKIPSEANPTLAGERQANLHEAMEKNPKVVAERDKFLTDYLAMTPAERKKVCTQIAKDLNQKGDKYAMELMETLDTLAEYDLATSENFDLALTEMGITNKKDRRKLNVALMGGIISTAGDKTKSAEYKKTITKNSHDHSKAVLEYLISDNDNKKALLENISTQFPLKDLMEGKEWAILGEKGGGINLDRDTITKCLGADKFDDVVEKLVIVDYNGEPTLAYAADNGKRTIPIGVLNCRPDGIMYGSTWKLELSIHEGFADCCKGHDK